MQLNDTKFTSKNVNGVFISFTLWKSNFLTVEHLKVNEKIDLFSFENENLFERLILFNTKSGKKIEILIRFEIR